MDINLISQILEKPKIRRFGANAVRITRSGLSSNPTQRLNFVDGDVFSNDVLTKHGNSFFIGGDTATFEYDFSTKVANSVAECPCRVYRTNIDVIQTPTGSWVEYTDQTNIDKLKTQDGQLASTNNSVNNYIAQALVEIDLTPLANKFYGGSNSALKAALKAITVDVWAMGSGSNGGVSANGVETKLWNNDVAYTGTVTTNSTNAIAKRSYTTSSETAAQSKINSSNKMYVLIHATYASDGTIASSVSLDYINVKVDLTRAVDTVQPIPVNLPKYWAMVVKGFSPNWTTASTAKAIWQYNKDNSNKFYLYYDSTNSKLTFAKKFNGTWVNLTSNVLSLSKFQNVNIITGQTSSGVFMILLKNSGIAEKFTNTDVSVLTGIGNIYYNQIELGTNQSDAFADSFTLIDLTNKPNGYTDAEATAILNGTASGWENPELFDINAVTLHPNAVRNNGVITLNATGDDQGSFESISVLPNNRYEIKCTVSGYQSATIKPYITPMLFYNNIFIGYGYTSSSFTSNGVYTLQFTTPQNCNKVSLNIGNKGIGTFTFNQISLRRKD